MSSSLGQLALGYYSCLLSFTDRSAEILSLDPSQIHNLAPAKPSVSLRGFLFLANFCLSDHFFYSPILSDLF
jgi:hypothetical protein